ncbi:hypothetical protein VTL71DRAFT_7019 [Oculimacula yallundae]|uniref:Uncharacterized protein n=1 Tax=Oculimacula yallundae TaxID=86028 RepID=A0ABR4BVH8_9HELO
MSHTQPHNLGPIEVEDVTADGHYDDESAFFEVTEYEKGSGTKVVCAFRIFKVSRNAILKIQRSNDFVPSATASGGLKGFTIEAVRLWLRIIHDSVVSDQYDISLEEIWNALHFGMKFEFPLQRMKPWYKLWLERNHRTLKNPPYDRDTRQDISYGDLKQHLFPSYALHHRGHFAYVTMTLSYLGKSYTREVNPSRYHGMNVPSRVLGKVLLFLTWQNVYLRIANKISDQISAAKGSMRGDLNEALLDIACPKIFCPHKCRMATEAYWQYMSEVTLTKLWPVSIQYREAIQTMLDSIGMTNWTRRRVPGACRDCCRRLDGFHVREARRKGASYWTGMCLGCVKLSLTGADTGYSAFFAKDERGNHDDGCKMSHGRNEWYHSFMGPSEVYFKYKDEKDLKKGLPHIPPAILASMNEKKSGENQGTSTADNMSMVLHRG